MVLQFQSLHSMCSIHDSICRVEEVEYEVVLRNTNHSVVKKNIKSLTFNPLPFISLRYINMIITHTISSPATTTETAANSQQRGLTSVLTSQVQIKTKD